MKNMSFIRGEAEVMHTHRFPMIFNFDREDGDKVQAEFIVSIICDDDSYYDVDDVSLVDSTHELTDKEYDELDNEINDMVNPFFSNPKKEIERLQKRVDELERIIEMGSEIDWQ